MANKFCFKAFDKTLRDILCCKFGGYSKKPFKGITVVLGNDFRHILPVILKGRCNNIIDASITSSYLWPYFDILTLGISMRLLTNICGLQSINDLAKFDRWLLSIGDRSSCYISSDHMVWILNDMMVVGYSDPMKAIIDAIYLDLLAKYKD